MSENPQSIEEHLANTVDRFINLEKPDIDKRYASHGYKGFMYLNTDYVQMNRFIDDIVENEEQSAMIKGNRVLPAFARHTETLKELLARKEELFDRTSTGVYKRYPHTKNFRP